MSSGSILFVIVGRNEPLFEAEFTKRRSDITTANDTVTRQNYFVLHSALDLVERAAWTSNNMYLRVVDKVSQSSVMRHSKESFREVITGMVGSKL